MHATLDASNRDWSVVSRNSINNSLRSFGCLESSPWLAFAAIGENRDALLDWLFRWQEANEGFFVERSGEENGPFTTLDWVPAKSLSAGRDYAYVDEDLPFGVYYYRLRQLNQDGAEYITPARRVVISYPEGVRISPNPATDLIRIVSDEEVASNYRITDIAGRVVRSGRVALGVTEVNLSGLASGVYLYYEVEDKETRFVTKFVKR